MESLKALRLAAGLSQKDVGDRLGVSQGLVSQWEAGRRVVTEEQAARLRDVLGGDVPSAEATVAPKVGPAPAVEKRAERPVEAANMAGPQEGRPTAAGTSNPEMGTAYPQSSSRPRNQYPSAPLDKAERLAFMNRRNRLIQQGVKFSATGVEGKGERGKKG